MELGAGPGSTGRRTPRTARTGSAHAGRSGARGRWPRTAPGRRTARCPRPKRSRNEDQTACNSRSSAGPGARSFTSLIVVPRSPWGNRLPRAALGETPSGLVIGRPMAGFSRPLEAADRLVGHVGVIALADEQPQGPLACAVVGGRRPHPTPQEVHGGGDLGLRVLRYRLLDQRRGDARRVQALADALGAPPVEVASILGQRAGVASIVEVALMAQLGERALGRLLAYPARAQVSAYLGHAAGPARQIRVGELQRALKPPSGVSSPSGVGLRERVVHAARRGPGSGRLLLGRLDRGQRRRVVRLDRSHQVAAQPQRLVDLALQLTGHVGMLVEVGLGVAPALTDAL